ncbi:MAG TPA: Crp/Fnr family transcriptional regulator [Stellaceae bacterium]|nr:Crp/Fnr family transcriptional regulator [Stellaceae bacterium]
MIGLDAVLRGRPLEKVLTLTSIATKTIDAKDALADLMMSRPTALYITWLLGQRQRRADRLLATISSLDARGRVTSILLDFYTRLGRQRLITGSTYNLPMTQTQIGAYLGLTVAHVNRVLRSLRDERIVNFEKHCVTILDLDRLARLAQNAQAVSSIAGLDERPLDEPVPSSGQLIQITGDYSSRLGLQRRTDHGVS